MFTSAMSTAAIRNGSEPTFLEEMRLTGKRPTHDESGGMVKVGEDGMTGLSYSDLKRFLGDKQTLFTGKVPTPTGMSSKAEETKVQKVARAGVGEAATTEEGAMSEGGGKESDPTELIRASMRRESSRARADGSSTAAGSDTESRPSSRSRLESKPSSTGTEEERTERSAESSISRSSRPKSDGSGSDASHARQRESVSSSGSGEPTDRQKDEDGGRDPDRGSKTEKTIEKSTSGQTTAKPSERKDSSVSDSGVSGVD